VVPVPTLDQLAEDPGQVAKLPREIIAVLYEQIAVLEARLRSRLLAQPAAAEPPAPPSPDEWISAEEVTRRFGLDPPWLTRHRRLLRGRKILATPSRKKSLYHLRRLARFLEDRTA
jgi:hypothetical protein